MPLFIFFLLLVICSTIWKVNLSTSLCLMALQHCVKSVQIIVLSGLYFTLDWIRWFTPQISVYSTNTRKWQQKKNLFLDTFFHLVVGNKAKGRISKRVDGGGEFSEKRTFLTPNTHTYVCVLGGKKCSFFGKFGVLCFLDTTVLRFALLPHYRPSVE